MGVGDVCPYCGANQRKLSVKLVKAARAGGGGGSARFTQLFVGLNLFLYAVAIAVGGIEEGGGVLDFLSPDYETLFRLGMQHNPAVEQGDWWRLVMPIFLHLGLLHVAFNTYILWVAGRHVEVDFGSRLMFLIYMASGLVGFIASYFAGIGGAGASGAVSGLLGCILVRRRMVDGHFRDPITVWIIQLIILTAIFGFFVARVNNVAHLGGFLTGAALAALLTKVKLSRAGAVGLMLVTSALMVVTVAAVVTMALNLGRGAGSDVIAVERCVRLAQVSLASDGRSVDPQRGEAAATCLAGVPRVGLGGDEYVRQVRLGVERAVEAQRMGDLVGEQSAVIAARGGIEAFDRWLVSHAARYGLGLRSVRGE